MKVKNNTENNFVTKIVFSFISVVALATCFLTNHAGFELLGNKIKERIA